MTKIIAIIPARSGSKGLKDKNIKMLQGKPMLAYTIEAAINSNIFDEVFVSTDSVEYQEIAIQYGANVPFLRSEALSSDQATTTDVIIEVINKYKSCGKEFDAFMVLQPTSPLRTSSDIKNAYELYRQKSAEAIVSVCESEHSPLLCNTLEPSLLMDNFLEQLFNKRRQDLPTYYRLNGAIYLSNVKRYLEDKTFYHEKSYAYIMDKKHSVDVDDIIDFKIAEVMLNYIRKI